MKESDNYSITPWFSRAEWEEVFDNIFGNSAEGWKLAYDTILVWKARVSKLPVGIECTIPVLHAQIAIADLSLDNSVKNSILNMAILRFVSITTQGFEDHYTVGKAMHNLASHMNLPPYLVDLRNQIIHHDSISGTSHTLEAAVKICLEWIKVYYWDEEANRSENSDEKNDLEVPDSQVEPVTEEPSVTEMCEEYDQFFNDLKNVNKHLQKSVDRESMKILKSSINTLSISFKSYYRINPYACMDTLVKKLFFSKQMRNLYEVTFNEADGTLKKCKRCGCFIPAQKIHRLSGVITILKNFDRVDQFLEALLKNGEEYPNLCFQWMTAFVNSLQLQRSGEAAVDTGKLPNRFENSCRVHAFQLKRPQQMFQKIRWKSVLYKLFCCNQNCRTLALQLLDTQDYDPNTRSALVELTDLYAESLEEPKVQSLCLTGESVISQSQNIQVDQGSIKDLNSLLMESHKLSSDVCSYVRSICGIVQGSEEKDDKFQKSMHSTPLGLLPHQQNSPAFHHQLMLSSLSSTPS